MLMCLGSLPSPPATMFTPATPPPAAPTAHSRKSCARYHCRMNSKESTLSGRNPYVPA